MRPPQNLFAHTVYQGSSPGSPALKGLETADWEGRSSGDGENGRPQLTLDKGKRKGYHKHKQKMYRGKILH